MLELNKIYHADCMDGMAELPQGHKYCVVTDPPFNVGYHYNEYNDRKEEGEYYQWLQDITNGHPCVIIHYPEALYKFAFQIGQVPERVVAWVYNSNTPRQHRDIAYFGIKPDFTLMHQPYKNPTDKRIAKRIAEGHEGGYSMTGWKSIRLKTLAKIRCAQAILAKCLLMLCAEWLASYRKSTLSLIRLWAVVPQHWPASRRNASLLALS